jgi:hypothetical protein
VVGFPLNSRRSASKSPQTFRITSSQNLSMPSSKTPRRYLVTKTK